MNAIHLKPTPFAHARTPAGHHEHRAAILMRHFAPIKPVDFNQVSVYNNQMQPMIDCAGCGRRADPSHADGAYCHECGERVTAEAALEVGADDMTPTDIAAINDYIEQMKAAAIAKGGQFDDLTEPPPTTTEPPTMSKHKHRPKKDIITAPSGVTPTTYKGEGVHRKQRKPKNPDPIPGRPMGERNQGRKPIAPNCASKSLPCGFPWSAAIRWLRSAKNGLTRD